MEEDDVAVIGIGCNFPGGEGLDKFWNVLLGGRNCVADIPAERFDSSSWYSTDETKAGKTCTTKAALIDGFNEFDHRFFNITEAESNCMDPQQKLLLQCTYRALEDAGVSMESISGSRTGVYIGLMNRDYEMLRNNDPNTVTHYNATGTAASVAANRISFTFNLTGPSFAVDSACSSSMVALHLACQAIKLGDCETALCGGVNCIIEPRIFVALSKARMISPGGTSKPFSNEADGYGRGEGCGVVLLKPLRNAVKDYNKIWGVISKTAVNQDGHSVTPITKPSMTQQEELLGRIYSESDLANVQYIEAHGTGTKVGDPTEAESISNAIAKARPTGSKTLWVGSVKGNIGHTESAAGVAGLIKVLLMMKQKTIVPSVFYSKDGSSIDVEALDLNIPTKPERWETNESEQRTAGINSFGFGGTNAHAIVKEYRSNSVPTGTPEGSPKLFVLSAASEKSLMLTIRDSHQRLCDSETVDLQALSHTSTCGRSHKGHKYRKAFLTTSNLDLQHQLESAVKSKVESTKSDVQVVFVFCGNGLAYEGMCQQLLKEVPVFRDKVMEIERLFQHHQSYSITQWLDDGFKNHDFRRPDMVQPVLFAIQVGISTVLKHWGLKPDAVLGHSVGEVAAAHCSGLLSLGDAVKVLYHRSNLQSKVTGGEMLVVSNVAVEEVEEILTDFSGRVTIAAFNSPESCTLAGDSDAIDLIQEKLKIQFKDKNLFLHPLEVPAAYHSYMMDPILDDIQRNVHVLDVNSLKCKLFSTVTADKCSDGDFTSGRYWAENIRKPVLFQQTLRAVTKDEQFRRNVVFVEVAPRRALQRNICETLGNNAIVLTSVQPQRDYETILNALGRAFELGLNVDWHQVYISSEMLPTGVPVYQFDNSKKQINFEDIRRGNSSPALPSHELISQLKTANEYMYTLSVESAPYFWQHKNNGVSIVPGSSYVEIAYTSVMASLKPKKPVSLLQISIKFDSIFTLTSNSHQLKVILEQTKDEVSFRILSAAAVHAKGTCKIHDSQPMIEEPTIAPDVIFQRCRLIMDKRVIYSTLSQAGFEYGSVFNRLDYVHFGDEFKEAVTEIQVPEELLTHLHDHFLHPVLLDYFLQMGAALAFGNLTARPAFPSGISSVSISAPLQETMIMYLRATAETPDFLEVCGCFATTQGNVLVELQKVRFTFLGKVPNAPQSLFFHSELIPVLFDLTEFVDCKLKAIVFADNLCISKRLKPYLDPESVIVEHTDDWTSKPLRESLKTKINLNHAAFMWGIENLNHLTTDQTLETLVSCCETFRQILLLLKEIKPSCTVHVITYRSSELTVDHISPGFMLSGITRACAAEVSSLSFQLIDLASVTNEDIQMLIKVIQTSKPQEVVIRNGQVLATKISRTQEMEKPCEEDDRSRFLSNFILQTGDSYRMTSLSTVPDDTSEGPIPETSAEIQLTHACVHSSDYFPVTTSHLNFGRTIYWNQHTSHNHQLLVLDFSGVVTAVGKNVRSLAVGDHIVSCYPVVAKNKIRVPEATCYNTKYVPFLKGNPCVSYFILAWEILRNITVKDRHRKLTIISRNTASALMKVLALTANRSGWNVSSTFHFREATKSVHQSHAFVFLPPFDHTGWQDIKESSFFESHIVFVYSSHMSSTHLADMHALNSEHVHLHNVDVAEVLQKTFLRLHNRNVFNWLRSLGFSPQSLPLRKETFQLLTKETPKNDSDSESYFTTKTVRNVVLDHGESDRQVSHIPVLNRSRQLFKKHCVYIITGGRSGLGLETVKFVAHNGGGCIATLSRSVCTNEMQVEMELLQKKSGVSIIHVQCDVSVSVQVMEAITKIRQRFPSCPIKGVFHSAAVLHDALIENLDRTLFQKVLKPKVCGALNLHSATLHNKLDYFVCYSSISSFIGNTSQCNYAAGNSFLDLFCHYRRNLGLAGQSINWGPLNLGLLLKRDHYQKFLEAKGMMTIDVWEVHKALEKCLLMNRPQQVICKFNFKNLNTHVLSQNTFLRRRLLTLVETELQGDVMPEPASQLVSSRQESVRKIVSDIINVSEEELVDDSALCALGIDSMLAMTLQNNIFQETGVNVPLVKILDPSSSLSTLAAIVMNNGSCHLHGN